MDLRVRLAQLNDAVNRLAAENLALKRQLANSTSTSKECVVFGTVLPIYDPLKKALRLVPATTWKQLPPLACPNYAPTEIPCAIAVK